MEKGTEETILKLLKPITEEMENPSPSTPAWGDPRRRAQAHSDDVMSSVAPNGGAETWRVHTRKKKIIIGTTQKESTMYSLIIRRIPNVMYATMIKSTRAQYRTKSRSRKSDARSEKFGNFVTADHEIQNEENESRCGHTRHRCSRWLHELDPELPDEQRKRRQKQRSFTEISFSESELWNYLHG